MAVIVAILAVVLLSASAVVIDLGHAREVRRQAQNGADAAALAAGNSLYLHGSGTPDFAAAVAAAKNYALTNFAISDARWATCADSSKLSYLPDAALQCVSFDQQVHPTTVRVRLPVTKVSTALSKIMGVTTVDVGARAHSSFTLKPPSQCGLCVLGSGLHDLQNGDTTVTGGDIHFNGSVSVSNNGLVSTTGEITVQGNATGPLANYTPDPETSQPAITDPLSFMTLPPDMSSLSVKSNPCTDGPGKYGSFNFANSLCTLLPGVYVIAGSSGTEWKLAGNSSQILAGTGVTLYFTCGSQASPVECASGATGADLDASGNGSIAIQAPTSGPLQGLAIAYDRKNAATFRLTGNGASGMSGTIYLKSGKLQMNGNGCANINALLVINDLEMNGSPSCLISTYDASQNVWFPPSDMHLSQ